MLQSVYGSTQTNINKVSTDEYGMADIKIEAAYYGHTKPILATAVTKTYSLIVSSQVEGASANSLVNMFFDDMVVMSPIVGGPGGGTAVVSAVINHLKTIHWKETELKFAVTDWVTYSSWTCTVSPAAGATNVDISRTISAIFSRAMDTTTITTNTFTLSSDGVSVPAVVIYDPTTRTATLVPTSSLNYNTTYTATVTKGAKDDEGGGPDSDYSWTFTTKSEASAITAFSLASPVTATGNINEIAQTVSITVPYDTNVTAMTASFSTTMVSDIVTIGSITTGERSNHQRFHQPRELYSP